MSSLDCIWKECRLPLPIKIRVYLALVQSVLLYAFETWTLTSADAKSLEAFHMKCQRRMLRISWRQFVRNSDRNIRAYWSTCHQRRHPTSSHRRLWSHRQTAGQTLAHKVLQSHVILSLGRLPHPWSRRPGRAGRPCTWQMDRPNSKQHQPDACRPLETDRPWTRGYHG